MSIMDGADFVCRKADGDRMKRNSFFAALPIHRPDGNKTPPLNLLRRSGALRSDGFPRLRLGSLRRAWNNIRENSSKCASARFWGFRGSLFRERYSKTGQSVFRPVGADGCPFWNFWNV